MENILKIIYDKSINNKVLELKDIDKILELLVVNKCLNDYILNINIQPIRSNNLASYSSYTKNITIYTKVIEQMIKNIEKNILIASDLEISMYKNLSILQVLLHEVEHANQQKIAYNENSLEALIIRMSYLIHGAYGEKLYEFCPEERFAEIKSFEDLLLMINYLNKKLNNLSEILNTEKLQRLLRGYHYINGCIDAPLITYFTIGKRADLLNCFDLNTDLLNERMKFGFPISIDEYGISMRTLVLSLNQNFKNKINIQKNVKNMLY